MATNSTTSTVTEQVTESVEMTVRITSAASGTLFDAAESQLARIPSVSSVTLTDSGAINPRRGATYVTVTADVTVSGAMSDTEIVDLLDEQVCVENVELSGVT